MVQEKYIDKLSFGTNTNVDDSFPLSKNLGLSEEEFFIIKDRFSGKETSIFFDELKKPLEEFKEKEEGE